MLSPKFSIAFSLACDFHATQVRKSTTIPYISHLMSVSALTLEFGGSENHAIAALLHDAVEDADSANEALRRRTIIRETFDIMVCEIVEGCTDGVPDSEGVKPDWHSRKKSYLSHLQSAEPDTLLVSCADKLHNARAILSDLRAIGPAVFDRFNAGKEGTLWYYQELANIFARGLPGALSQELARTVEELVTISSAQRNTE